MAGPPKRLSVVSPHEERLGVDTIMDRTLAAQHGIPYVHLAAFAIDTDRVREALDDDSGRADDTLPFGWEVFLTAQYMRTRFVSTSDAHRIVLEDAVLSVLDDKKKAPRLGAQLAFAVYDLVRRGLLPEEMRPLFDAWKKKPDKALDDLEGLWEDAAESAGVLSHACLQVELAPPASPPTMEAWGAMVLAGRIA